MRKRILLLLLCAYGCGNVPKQKGLVYFNDFETTKGWQDLNLSRQTVHSGVFSDRVDSAHPYGATLKVPFKDIANGKVNNAKVSMWAYMEPEAKTSIIVEVRKPDQTSLLYKAYKIESMIREGTWQKIEVTVPINDSINRPDNLFIVYPWNLGKSGMFIDDIRIEFELSGS